VSTLTSRDASVSTGYVKSDPRAPEGFFAAEARGLAWLAAAPGGVRVAEVRAVHATSIEIERLRTRTPTPAAAEEFGAALARTHAAGAPVWGGIEGDGFIGPLPLPNGPFPTWADLWWQGRVEPYLRRAVDGRRLDAPDALACRRAVERWAGQVPAARPARIHGDLWSGNVMWTDEGAVLIDAGAAHGGHPETDLAMLALFGLPHLERALRAYDAEVPLTSGWRDRVPLMQLHPLLVHVVLFGGGYASSTRAAVSALT
jgi:fructosamine-3-kinase